MSFVVVRRDFNLRHGSSGIQRVGARHLCVRRTCGQAEQLSVLEEGEEVRERLAKIGGVLAAQPPQLGDVLVEQVDSVVELHAIFAFRKQRKAEKKTKIW